MHLLITSLLHDNNALFHRTYIFTMDSLGTRHPQAIKRLANYLKMEAQDKKGVQDTSSAIGKFASVHSHLFVVALPVLKMCGSGTCSAEFL